MEGCALMEQLTTTQLENIFKDKINSRTIINDSKLGRIIEKIEFLNRKALIKYGWDADLQKEISIYEEVLNNPEKYPVPKLLVRKKINNIHLLAIEWIDGIHPDFRNTIHIENVFTSLGRWAADWSHRIKYYNYINRDTLSDFEDLDNLLINNKNTLINILGNPLIDLLNNCSLQSENIIKNIEKMPLTLNPGDISLHNIIINSDEKVIYIDFESCTVSSMITLVEHFGEDYESIPHKKGDILLALKSFLNSWNKFSNVNIEWDDFVHSQLCARIYYNIGNFNYWINRILEDNNIEETLEWIKHGHEQLQLLLLSYMKSVK